MDPKELFDRLRTASHLTYATSSPTDPEDYDAIPEEVAIVLAFSEKGVGFGQFTIVQKQGHIFVDTECMSIEKVKACLNAMLDWAIPDYSRDPEKHLLYSKAMGRQCGIHCDICHPGAVNLPENWVCIEKTEGVAWCGKLRGDGWMYKSLLKVKEAAERGTPMVTCPTCLTAATQSAL